MKFNDLGEQYRLYREEIEEAIDTVLKSGAYIMGREVGELEELLARYVGVNHCVTTSSGTDSLLMALMASGIAPGDEVITVPFTWISTAEVIALLGARPVFVDIDPESYLIDCDAVERAITAKSRAIIAVDLFGQIADYERLSKIASNNDLALIQDGAQSFGARRHGRRSCSQAPISATSFFPAKPLGCYGDGGALFTDDDAIAAKLRAIRTHGGERRHHHTEVGINGRLDTLQAAILLVKLRHFDEELAARERIAKRYSEALEGIVDRPATVEGNSHIFACYTIRHDERDALSAELGERGVPTAVYYPKCLHEQPVFHGLGYGEGAFPESEKASRSVLSLPIHPFLSDEEVERVIDGVTAFCCGVSAVR